ncbi:hypothetical protein [Microbulbifer celer]|uniref:Uncharacterized protein n=1 Tax=Microbulbifer celer TaxID=435905 RepID=A0ABW3U6H4_9GAMM|nr:hypothetical protein [Microbulbifer celer]UFN56607.1 hypothetical protein LPW13_13680 [Microbulbifer celer]
MSWTKSNMAAGAAWGILAHQEVAQINPELTPFADAGSYSLAMLRYYNPQASAEHREIKAITLTDKFTAYLFHFYRPAIENLSTEEDRTLRLKKLEEKLIALFKAPEGKTLDDLAQLLDAQLMFADEVQDGVENAV